MKHNIYRLAILFAIMISASGAQAQEAPKTSKLHSEAGLFNHLSVGLNMGLTGLGLDVAMPVHKIVTVRAGFAGLNIGSSMLSTTPLKSLRCRWLKRMP